MINSKDDNFFYVRLALFLKNGRKSNLIISKITAFGIMKKTKTSCKLIFIAFDDNKNEKYTVYS